MECGISTACFFPKDTIASVKKLQALKINSIEIFLNSFCEIEEPYITKLKKQLSVRQTSIFALHPFSSGLETFFFASTYKTRFKDGLELYTKYFKLCKDLAIPRLVFHGDYKDTAYSFLNHSENYLNLRKVAREYGVNLCYENVVRCKCSLPYYIEKLREYTKDDVSFVLDIKQQRRSNIPLDEVVKAMSGKIDYLHLSDYNDSEDCITPGKGNMNFKAFFEGLKSSNFFGDMVIELYNHGYTSAKELQTSAAILNLLFQNEDGA